MTIKLRPRIRRKPDPPAPLAIRVAAHAALDGLLNSGCMTFLLHGESPQTMWSVSVPQSDALAEGIARRVFHAWFQPSKG